VRDALPVAVCGCYRCVVVRRQPVLDEYMARKESRGPQITLESDCLRWSPVVSSEMLQEEARTARLEVSPNNVLLVCVLYNPYILGVSHGYYIATNIKHKHTLGDPPTYLTRYMNI